MKFNTQELEHLFKIHTIAAERITYNEYFTRHFSSLTYFRSFLVQMLPQADSILKNQCLNRASRGQAELNQSDQIALDRDVLQVFQREIEFFRRLKQVRGQFPSGNELNPGAIFKLIDVEETGIIESRRYFSFPMMTRDLLSLC